MVLNTLKRLAVGLAAAGSIVAAACGNTPAQTTSTAVDAIHPYKVLAIVAASGAFKPVTDLQLNALNVAADKINATGGIQGRKLTLDVADDAGDPAKAVSLLQQAINGANKPDAVYAGTTSNETLAMLPILTSAKIFNIGTTSSAKIDDPANYPYTFRPTGPNSIFAGFAASTMKTKGYKKVALVAANDAIGQSFVSVYKTAFSSVGVGLAVESYNATDLDVTPQLQRLMSGNPDAFMFNANNVTIAPLILKGRQKLGITLPFYGDVGVNADLYNLAGAEAVKNSFVMAYRIDVVPSSGTNPPAIADFLTGLKERGPVKSQLAAATLAWDALKLIQAGAKQAGSVDPDKMRSALENLKTQPDGYFLTYGQAQFSPSTHFNQGGTHADFTVSTIGPVVDGQYKAAP
jgi:branched-chain amino acid transport system substrate-binding protein